LVIPQDVNPTGFSWQLWNSTTGWYQIPSCALDQSYKNEYLGVAVDIKTEGYTGTKNVRATVKTRHLPSDTFIEGTYTTYLAANNWTLYVNLEFIRPGTYVMPGIYTSFV
jgi:hypothetical protein